MSWKDLNKNDKLYVLVPVFNENYLHYEIQESYIINSSEYDKCVNLRFKYTNQNNKRQRINRLIYDKDINNDYIVITKNWLKSQDLNKAWGKIIIGQSKDILINVLKELINIKINEINENIKMYSTIINKLTEYKNKLQNI